MSSAPEPIFLNPLRSSTPMATHRRVQTLTRHLRYLLSSTPHPIPKSQTLILRSLQLSSSPNPHAKPSPHQFLSTCHLSSRTTDSSGEDENDEEEGVEEEEDSDAGESCNGLVKNFRVSGKSEEEKSIESAEIGYKVIGPLDPFERPFKPYEPAFAVVQIGSHQFKVSNGDSIFTERLKFCEVNDKLILNKVLMLGSQTQTIIGRPILPDAAVHAVVEEHALDAKVIIFKKKRRKNYRRTKGHRQELTKLRITDIQGIEKSEGVSVAA